MEQSHETRLRRALTAIQSLRNKVAALENAAREPIAIIGMGCRYPQAENPDQFWQLLEQGLDATAPIPAERWSIEQYYDSDPQAAGKMTTRSGGFLDQVDQFDPHFFRLSPREAINLDPQQRLLLEVCWETLEHGGQSADSLANSKTGVFVGIAGGDYAELLMKQGHDALNSFVGSGNAHSVAAGRIAFFLGLNGPVLAIDTACSSSLVALHTAVQSLRNRDCDQALAGGVNVILTPTIHINHSRAQMLAPDGRCKTFDAAADGFSRAEGCGIVMLKRLSDAEKDGDNILAVIRGSSVNHDGRTSGITVPNGPSQQTVIRQALENAGVTANEIDYVEAHGTGTSLGDPIEIGALGAVFSQRTEPLLVGSVKTNLGHPEAAAGIAGVIKLVLALQHEILPRHLNFNRPNPRIDWEMLPIEIPTESRPWKANAQPRLAGVSSFGFGGTNAHMILSDYAQPPAPDAPHTDTAHPNLLVLSAKNKPALHALAGRYADYLRENPTVNLTDLCYTAATGRSHFIERAAFIGSAETLIEQLTTVTTPETLSDAPPKIAFLFTGQGAQFVGMGAQLYANEPVFRTTYDRCLALLQYNTTQLRDSDTLDQTEFTQPALFALEYALAELWRSWGVVPDVVMGHSVGEIVAACVAGVFSLEDGLRLIAARGRLMQALPQNGRMLVVSAAETTVRTWLEPYPTLSIAAINTPENSVISGDAQAITQLETQLQDQGIRTKALSVSHAFHSALMEPMLAEFAAVAQSIRYHAPTLDIVSNVSGKIATDAISTPEYWVSHVREAVRFADGMQTLSQLEINLFVEIGPKPTLLGMGRHCLPDVAAQWLPSLRPTMADDQQLALTLGLLYCAGVRIDWKAVYAQGNYQRLQLPTYPFQRKRYWVDLSNIVETRIEQPSSELRDYQLVWEVGERVSAEIPSPTTLHTQLLPAFTMAQKTDAIATYATALQTLDQLAAEYVSAAFTQLGWRFELGQQISAQHLSAVLSIAEIQQKRVPRFLNILTHAGYLEQTGDQWRVITLPPTQLPAMAMQVAQHRFVESSAEFSLLKRCGSGLADILRGTQDPLPLIFPNGDTREAASVYEGSVGAQFMNGTLENAIQAAVADLPVGKRLRILEIGAGTGGATAYIVPHLPPAQVEYTFTDITPLFLARAQERFADYPFITYRTLNAENDPQEEGFDLAQFDLIIAFNVLHATRDLRETVAHVRQLLAPRGQLFLLENTVAMDWVDLIWGLTEDWWRFTDYELRDSQPLLTDQEWLTLLQEEGFGEIATLIPPDPALAKQALIMAQAGSVSTQWGILADGQGVAERLVDLLAKRGIEGVFVSAENLPTTTTTTLIDCRAFDIPACESTTIETATPLALVELTQTLAEMPNAPRLWVLTQGVQAVAQTIPTGLSQSPLWGIGKGIGLEHPDFWGGLIDLETVSSDTLEQMIDQILAPDGEDLVAFYDGGTRHVARLVDAEPPTHEPVEISTEGTYLVTGGMSGLGLKSADYLISHGARSIALLGRRGVPSAEAQIQIEQWEMDGVRVGCFAADVADLATLETVFATLSTEWQPLHGLIHAAGVPVDSYIRDLDSVTLKNSLAAKVSGTWHLHQLTADLDLEFFVCFSSMVSFWGAARQAHYVAANQFMDTFVQYRRGLNLPALALNWGPIYGGMFRAGLDEELSKMGIRVSPLSTVNDTLDRWLGANHLPVAVVDIEWQRLKAVYEMRQSRPLFTHVGKTNTAALLIEETPATEAQHVTLMTQFETVALSERKSWLAGEIGRIVTHILHLDTPPNHRIGFFDLGFDSLTSLELKARLDKGFGLQLPSTLIFDYATIVALTDYLLTQLSIEDNPVVDTSVQQNGTLAALPSTTDIIEMSDEDVAALLMEKYG